MFQIASVYHNYVHAQKDLCSEQKDKVVVHLNLLGGLMFVTDTQRAVFQGTVGWYSDISRTWCPNQTSCSHNTYKWRGQGHTLFPHTQFDISSRTFHIITLTICVLQLKAALLTTFLCNATWYAIQSGYIFFFCL